MKPRKGDIIIEKQQTKVNPGGVTLLQISSFPPLLVA